MIAGDGELRSQVTNTAAEHKISLHLLGFCNQSQMPAVYAACDLLVLPSDGRETWGLVANEALSCGRPIIVSDACGCAPDLAADPASGQTFPVGDVEVLSQRIERFVLNPLASESISRISRTYSVASAGQGIHAAIAGLT
jgi:glycosyltransferase involved in cell wall biosynthesis